MKAHIVWLLAACFAWSAASVNGQVGSDEKGFELGPFHVQPVIKALAAYDDRVIDSPADGDVYGETEASLSVNNTDARYDVGGWASYGYRAYDKYAALNDDFYGMGGSIASRGGRLKSGFSGYFKKTLDYDVSVDGDGELGSILTSSTSERGSAKVDVGYERQVTDKSAIMPMYQGWYYFQNFEDQQDAEWQEHRASLEYGYGMSPRMLLMLSGGYDMQINDEEKGAIFDVSIGAKSRATDKLDWNAKLGVSSADYELSGTDQGVVGSLGLNWQATDKVSSYAFAGSSYQPGQGSGGARKVYRAGYGAAWAIVEKCTLDLQILHDYQDRIDGSGGPGLDDVRNFVTGRVAYDITRNIALTLAGSFIDDELEENQTIVSGKVVWTY